MRHVLTTPYQGRRARSGYRSGFAPGRLWSCPRRRQRLYWPHGRLRLFGARTKRAATTARRRAVAAEREAGPGSSVSVHGVEAGTAMRFWPTREVGASASSLAGDHLVVVSVLHRTVESRVTGARARSSALKNTSPCPSRYRVLTIWCAICAQGIRVHHHGRQPPSPSSPPSPPPSVPSAPPFSLLPPMCHDRRRRQRHHRR